MTQKSVLNSCINVPSFSILVQNIFTSKSPKFAESLSSLENIFSFSTKIKIKIIFNEFLCGNLYLLTIRRQLFISLPLSYFGMHSDLESYKEMRMSGSIHSVHIRKPLKLPALARHFLSISTNTLFVY